MQGQAAWGPGTVVATALVLGTVVVALVLALPAATEAPTTWTRAAPAALHQLRRLPP